MTRTQHLQLDPIRCDGHGHCADLLPELIALDEWGYPIISSEPVPASLRRDAKSAVTICPVLALRLIPVAR